MSGWLPREQACRANISALNGRLGAFNTISAPSIPSYAGPLAGMSIAVKANIAVAGLPWTAGIAAYRGRIADGDADCVALVRKAGTTILGTTNMDEGALGATTDNPTFGRTFNPWAPGFTAGGSSGGSAAAVAAGLCVAALGTDTFGSVRIPAAYCGLFGIKPALGAIVAAGVVPLSWTFDHVGIIARDAATGRALLAVLAPEPAPAASVDMIHLLEPDGWDGDHLLAHRIASASVRSTALTLSAYNHAALLRHALLIAEAEASVVHRDALDRDPEGFSPAFRKMLGWGARQPAVALAAAYRAVACARQALEAQLAGVRILLSATVPGPAYCFGDAPRADPSRYALLASILGWPAIAFPIGLGPDGLPRSAQVLARSTLEALAMAERLAAEIGRPPGYHQP